MKNIKKFSVLLLCLLLVFGTVLPICASDEAEEKPEWVLSEDLDTLTYGDSVYERVEISYGIWLRPYSYFLYQQKLIFDDPENEVNVCHPILPGEQGEDEIIKDVVFLEYKWNYENVPTAIYVNANSKHIMDDFNAGNYAQYELGWMSESAVIAQDAAKSWQSVTPDLTVDTQTLVDVPYHYLFGYDATHSFAKVLGVVFEIEGGYVYVQGEHCLDFNGLLTLRPGTMPAHRLQGQDAETVATAIENPVRNSLNFISEESEPVDASIAMGAFLLIASPLLFLLPALLLALGIVMRCVKKIPNRKRWNTVILLSAAWLGGSFVTSLLLLIPTFFL